MISPADTAYPVLTASPPATELTEAYTPDLFELKFAEERTREAGPRVALLVLLKTFQRLGYFAQLAEVPQSIVRNIAQTVGYDVVPINFRIIGGRVYVERNVVKTGVISGGANLHLVNSLGKQALPARFRRLFLPAPTRTHLARPHWGNRRISPGPGKFSTTTLTWLARPELLPSG
jgi:hypothetical protein